MSRRRFVRRRLDASAPLEAEASAPSAPLRRRLAALGGAHRFASGRPRGGAAAVLRPPDETRKDALHGPPPRALRFRRLVVRVVVVVATLAVVAVPGAYAYAYAYAHYAYAHRVAAPP